MPFVAGSSGMALRRLLPFSVVSAIAWTALFIGIGYAFSESIGDAATWVGLAVVLLVAAAYRHPVANSSREGISSGCGAGCVIRSGLPNGSRRPQSMP